MKRGVMLDVVRVEFAPEDAQPFAPLAFEQGPRVRRDGEQFVPRRLDALDAGRLGGGEVGAHALRGREVVDVVAQVREVPRGGGELARRAVECFARAHESFFERGLFGERGLDRFRRRVEATAHEAPQVPHARVERGVGQRLDLLFEFQPAPLAEPRRESFADALAPAPVGDGAERGLLRQVTRPLGQLFGVAPLVFRQSRVSSRRRVRPSAFPARTGPQRPRRPPSHPRSPP